MKSQTAEPTVLSVRCAYRSPNRRRCRLSVSDPRSAFCAQHRSQQLEEESADHYRYLSSHHQDFQTAQGINHSLHNLFALLAQNRISARRAAVLSHICGLLLRTLPQIDADRAAGILDLTKPVPINVSLSDAIADSEEDDVLDLDPGTHTETQPATKSNSHADPANSWDPSIPEPDPSKKPS